MKVFSILFGAKSFKLKSETLTLPNPLKSVVSNQTVAASTSRLLMVVSLAQFMVGGKSEVLMDTFIGGKLSSTSSSSSYRPSPTVPVPQSFSCSYGGLHAIHNISNIKNSVGIYNLGVWHLLGYELWLKIENIELRTSWVSARDTIWPLHAATPAMPNLHRHWWCFLSLYTSDEDSQSEFSVDIISWILHLMHPCKIDRNGYYWNLHSRLVAQNWTRSLLEYQI